MASRHTAAMAGRHTAAMAGRRRKQWRAGTPRQWRIGARRPTHAFAAARADSGTLGRKSQLPLPGSELARVAS
jgi:hypothetical protein